MSPKKVGVAPGKAIGRAKHIPSGKGWRVVVPGKGGARRASLIKKFKIDGKDFGVFRILPGTR